jgi:WD repeat-containing and planar cell polarity effector protein
MFISNEHRRSHPMYADPKKELAESLPLCHPHDDWLKDFAPVQGKVVVISTLLSRQSLASSNADRKDEADGEDHSKGGKNIKVIHFGVV